MILCVLVLEIVAILANLAMPVWQNTALHMHAADIARQMQQVRTAAESARARSGAWPDDQPAGVKPTELGPFLPPGFSFAHEDYQLDWDHWELADGKALGVAGDELAGIAVVSRNPRLAGAVARELRGGDLRLTLENRTTLVISLPSALSTNP